MNSHRTAVAAALLAVLSATALAQMHPAAGTLKVSVIDEAGNPLPARVHLRDSKGSYLFIPGQATRQRAVYKGTRPVAGDWFYTDGSFSIDVGAGEAQIAIAHGPAYATVHHAIPIVAGRTTEKTYTLRRLIDPLAMGWYSADEHLHQMPDGALMLAEDLNLAAVPICGGVELHYRPGQKVTRLPDAKHLLVSQLPAVEWDCFLWNLRAPLDLRLAEEDWPREDWATSDRPGRSTDLRTSFIVRTPLLIEQMHARGVTLIAYMHDPPRLWYYPLYVANGWIDVYGMLDNAYCAIANSRTEAEFWRGFDGDGTNGNFGIWYRFLNCGYRLPASAGTDNIGMGVGVWKGYNRVYAKLDGPLTVENWLDALKRGRSFVTNGWASWCLAAGLVLAGPRLAAVHAAPAHPRPFLMPPAEKRRLLERTRSNESARKQYEEIKARADGGSPGDTALVYALEGGRRYADTVRRSLLEKVRYRGPRLEEDVAAGGHREGNMDFYWDTAEVRWYDLVYPALSVEERDTIETFYRKLGRYWRDSLNRWTTTPNLVFPIHYHGAVIGFCMDDSELIQWGLRNPGGKFGPSRGGLFPVLDSMLRDGAIWDEATIYAAVNVLRPMMQLAILHKLYYGKDLFAYESPRGASIKKLVDGYIALPYPLERTGVGPGSFHIATYGDRSTESPYIRHHGTDSIYLVNLPWGRNNERHELTRIIEQAYYLSRDPKYAFFLSHVAQRTPSFLYGESIPPGSVKAPAAASSIFPEAGIAMLRADESPDYWTNGSIAVLQMMARGYGHDHRDKMMIVMHAAGRLFYPDMNCIQYEPPSINWTASTIANNTLVVDRGQAANSSYTTRHEFAPEVKFLVTSASCYPGVANSPPAAR